MSTAAIEILRAVGFGVLDPEWAFHCPTAPSAAGSRELCMSDEAFRAPQ